MDRITADHPDARSKDLVADNLDRLHQLFPQAFTEGGVDFDVLRQLLGDAVDDGEERFGLTWHGKAQARRLALTPSTGTLRPDKDASVDWDTTGNLIVEGDNLEVLKLLQKSYAGKVKLITIDPPYNTGNDFIYEDDFRDNIANYLEKTGQVDSEGVKVSSNSEASGRFHTAWLNMMYPRLMLARQLLAEDGALFVILDDHEVHNARHVLDTIFGDSNFVATCAWQKTYAKKNKAVVSGSHDHVLIYTKDASHWDRRLLPRSEDQLGAFKNPDGDPRGRWQSVAFSVQSESEEKRKDYRYPITTPSGEVVRPPTGRHWNGLPSRFEELLGDNRLYFGPKGDRRPRLKVFLSEVQSGIVPDTWWSLGDYGHNQEGKKEVLELFGDSEPFSTPKPTRLIRRMLQIGTSSAEQHIVLDFFAGSGTTADAVMQQNAEDGGDRRFILVQLPEATGRKDFPSIAHITRERVRRASRKLRGDNPLLAKTQDFGFRAYRLDSTNLKPWDASPDDLQTQLDAHIEHIKPGRTEDDLLTEVLLKLGLDLTVPIETGEIEGLTVHNIGAGQLLVCFGRPITRAMAAPLARGLLAWQESSRPQNSHVGTATALFRDSAFEDDVAKQNVVATLHQGGLTQVRSL